MLNENVTALLKKQLWYLGTCGDGPNVVPVGFKDVLPDGTMTVGDVFLLTTLKNIAANGKIAVAVCDPATMEGYQIKGTAKYVTEGAVVDGYKAVASKLFQGKLTAKGALLITPESVIVATPGPENKRVL